MNLPNLFPGARTTARNIFISYRVQDTAGETGRLVDALKERFDEKQIFIDIEKIEPGLDFSQVISRSLDACDVMLAIIGPNWLGAQPGSDTLRIQSPQDWVRQEISTALKRNIRVIPVLVDGAAMPPAGQLPDDLKPLLMRQAYEVSNKRWKYDTGQLMDFLEKSVGIPAKSRQVPAPPVARKSWLRSNLGWIVLVAGLAAFIWVLYRGITALTDPEVQKMVQDLNQVTGPDSVGTAHNLPPDHTVADVEKTVVNQEEGKGREQQAPTADQQQVVRQEPPAVGKQESPPVYQQPAALVHGTWIDVNGNFVVFSQQGSAFTVKGYTIGGYPIGSGSGVIQHGEISFDFHYQAGNVSQYLVFRVSLSPDGRYMNGTQTYQATGISTPFYLTKVQ